MRRLTFLAFLLVSLSGCCCLTTPSVIELGQEWRPLVGVVRDDAIPKGVYKTDGSLVLTGDLCDFVCRSRVDQGGILTHELVHIRRWEAVGRATFDRRYTDDLGFRLAEEQAGWSAQIRYMIERGESPDPSYIAAFMSSHYNFDGRVMIGYNDALAWVSQTIMSARAGR